MILISGRGLPGLVFLPAALILTCAAQADVIGTAWFIDEAGNDYCFSDPAPASPCDFPAPGVGPVSLSGYVVTPDDGSVTPRNGVLGQYYVNGDQSGDFDLSVTGQYVHANESTFSLTQVVENMTAVAQDVSAAILISAGELLTHTFEEISDPTEFLEAGYEITISFAGAVVFESAATLRQITNTVTGGFDETFTLQGTDLNGQENRSQQGVTQIATYTWDDFLATIDLGTLAPMTSGLFEYDVRTFVTGELFSCTPGQNCGRTGARIGDPLSISQTASTGPLTFAMEPSSPVSVPEPNSLALLLLGVSGLIGLRRRVSVSQ